MAEREPANAQPSSAERQAFFYGLLMHPSILKRILGYDRLDDRVQACLAILPDYTRHKVKGATYPAIIPYCKSREAFNHDLGPEGRCVRGMLVTGLTERDIDRLDVFEGDAYTREVVSVVQVGPLVNISTVIIDSLVSTVPSLSETSERPSTRVEVYVFDLGRVSRDLEPGLWDVEEFIRKDAVEWY